MTTKSFTCLLVLLAIATSFHGSVADSSSIQDESSNKLNNGTEQQRPASGAGYIYRNPFLLSAPAGIRPFGLNRDINSLKAANSSVISPAVPFFQNPYQYGYSPFGGPIYNGMLPYANRNAPFLRNGIAPYSPILNNFPYGGAPFVGAPLLNNPYYNGYGGFAPGLGYPINHWNTLGYRGINPYAPVFPNPLP